MGITGIFSRAGKTVLNRCFGVTTQRQMLAATTRAGRGIEQALKSGEILSEELAGSIIKKALPKGIKAPFVTTSIDTAVDLVRKNPLATEETIEGIKKVASGFHSLNPKTSESFLYIGGRVDGETVSHELRHYLDSQTSIRQKILNWLTSFRFKHSKNFEKECINIVPKIQTEYVTLEESLALKTGIAKLEKTVLQINPNKTGFLSRMGVSADEFSQYLQSEINNAISGFYGKERILALKTLLGSMKSEANAYHSGANVVRKLNGLNLTQSCGSDVRAIAHDEIVEVLEKTLKEHRKEYWKSKFGFGEMPVIKREELVRLAESSEHKAIFQRIADSINGASPHLTLER